MKQYDLAIIGGGLSGLSLAILQAKAGKEVILFEKNTYPFHRVCGEYISLESWSFLVSLGLELDKMNLPIIKKLEVSSPSGKLLNTNLDLGGFGISRYLLDFELSKIAISNGVIIKENTKVTELKYKNDEYEIKTDHDIYSAKKTIGSFGKRSNLDIDWKRPFIAQNRTSLNQYIGVKYHIKADFPKDLIALHNFKDGYCGISAIENDIYCLCYMTTKRNLKDNNNSIELMEENILKRNPHLKKILETCTKIWDAPQVISQISFEKKEQFYNGIPLVGDAAGMIAPLCGNGMSMALHGAYLINESLLKATIKTNYQSRWRHLFSTRLWVGRSIQRFFGNEIMTNIIIGFFKLQPRLLKYLISKTHGTDIGG
jgi:menaquinone-9 beta-reductase